MAILQRSHINEFTETTWQLMARQAATNSSAAEKSEIKKKSGAQAQILSAAPAATNETKFYFAELPGELQTVLRVQVHQPGDVSAVIETRSGFLLCVAKEKTDAVLSVADVFLPKCSYEQWLAEHSQE